MRLNAQYKAELRKSIFTYIYVMKLNKSVEAMSSLQLGQKESSWRQI